MSSEAPPERRELCPLCRKPTSAEHRPFCGRGCRDRDLLNWLGEAYRAPGPPAGPDDFGREDDGLDRQG
ncbi:DNA gyrase inhibitor YacG [Sphingosinicella sp. CPCC 101087]|uniref:DNA gyrase inhibitor YacG n=1 Tax=Sphingosinicella sp. CPCC 101087 TaxID=2497754 RepID=UPI00101D0208|nr:DNA gyrase inhibitor YacG [Sphingosinicella sp. CPCC 101087]